VAEYTVSNELELGEAVWLSGPGDTIRFLSGHYGRVIVKGCAVFFPEDRGVTVGHVIGYGGMTRNATLQGNVKSIFFFQKRLPFNLRVKPDEPYYHPTGAAVTLRGHDKEMGGPIGVSKVAQEQLPRAIVDIEVPRLEEINFDLLKERPSGPGGDWASHTEEQKKLHRLLSGDAGGLPFGDVEYTALWALNHFLRQYATVARSQKITGLSFAEFRDGLTLAYGRPSDSELETRTQAYIDEYHSLPFTDEDMRELQRLCLSSKDYSVSEYITFALEHLNYSMATVGMAQLLEANGLTQGSRWETIQASGLPQDQQRYLAEIFICRNVILHQHQCAIKANADGFSDVQRLFDVQELSEYRIYALKRPWSWYRDGVLPYLARIESTSP
jgi:hypothetical protein